MADNIADGKVNVHISAWDFMVYAQYDKNLRLGKMLLVKDVYLSLCCSSVQNALCLAVLINVETGC